jgi:hypothetical protein
MTKLKVAVPDRGVVGRIRMFRTKVLRAFIASVVFGLALSAVGCGDIDLNGGGGSGKGPEFVTTTESGRPVSGGSSVESQSTAPPGTVPVVSACRIDGACLGTIGCMGVCDPAGAVILACQRCVDGVFTDCTERTCQPEAPSP